MKSPFRPSLIKEQEFADKAGVSLKKAQEFLIKQPIYQIYQPAPKYIPRPTAGFHEFISLNDIHQADLLYLPHDGRFKYALTIVDVGTRYKAAFPLKTKTAKEVCEGFRVIYSGKPLNKPKFLQVDQGNEFRADVTKFMSGVKIFRSLNKRSVGVVERFNRTLAEKIFVHQYLKEIDSDERNTEWVGKLQPIIKELNNSYTRLIRMSPNQAIKIKNNIRQYPSQPKPKGYIPPKPLEINDYVRYLYEGGESEGDVKRRATDPIWSLKIYSIRLIIDDYYYLNGIKDRHFLREELMKIDQ